MSDYMAHGFCFLWEPQLVWLHVISDILAGLAYSAIPIALIYFLSKRKDVPFMKIFVLFGVFACGTTHFLAAYTVYVPAYWYEGIVKAFTALVSIIFVIPVIPLIPQAIAMPSLTKAMESLRESEAMLQSILDHSSTVVFLKDLEGSYITINRRYEELFHVTRKDVVDKSDYNIFSPEHVARYQQHDLLALHKGRPIEVEETVPQDDGLHTYISVKFPMFSVKGEPYAVCGIATDITERKRVEEEQRSLEKRLHRAEKMEALGTMAGGVAQI